MNKIKIYCSLAYINIIKWLFNHCLWVRKRMRDNAAKNGLGHLILLEMFMKI